MTKSELVDTIYHKLDGSLAKSKISLVLTIAFDSIKEFLVSSPDDDARFSIRGLGTLFKMSYGNHEFFNPRTQKREAMGIKKTIKFACSKVLKKNL